MAVANIYSCDRCGEEQSSYYKLYYVKIDRPSNIYPHPYHEIKYEYCNKCMEQTFGKEQLKEIDKNFK